MNASLPIFAINVLPLPGEVISISLTDEENNNAYQDVFSLQKTFGIYYHHFMNVYRVGSAVSVIGKTNGVENNTDIWVKGQRMFVLKDVFKNEQSIPYINADVEYMDYLEGVHMDIDVENDVKRFIYISNNSGKMLLEAKKHFDAFDVMRIMQLTDAEKFYALSMPSRDDLFVYMINNLRLRLAYYSQIGSIEEPWFLN